MARLTFVDLLRAAREFPEYRDAMVSAYEKLARGNYNLSERERRALALVYYLRNPWAYKIDLRKRARVGNVFASGGDVPGVDTPDAVQLFEWAARYVSSRRHGVGRVGEKPSAETGVERGGMVQAVQVGEQEGPEKIQWRQLAGYIGGKLLPQAYMLAERLATGEATALDRDNARALLATLERFEKILSRYIESPQAKERILARHLLRKLRAAHENLSAALAANPRLVREAIALAKSTNAALGRARRLIEELMHGKRLPADEQRFMHKLLTSLARDIKYLLPALRETLHGHDVEVQAGELGRVPIVATLEKLLEELEEAATKVATPPEYYAKAAREETTGAPRLERVLEKRTRGGRRYSMEAVRLANYLWENMPRSARKKWRYIQVLNLADQIIRAAGSTGADVKNIDWLHEIDWSTGYQAAKEKIRQLLMIGRKEYMPPQPPPEEENIENVPWWLREEISNPEEAGLIPS